MSYKTYYSLSVEKGLRGNIGKMAVVEKNNGHAFMDVMLFLVANGDTGNNAQSSQIVNLHFPQEAFEELEDYGLNDYVRIYFNRIDLTKCISNKTGKETLYISAKATGIELLKKAEKKEATKPTQQQKGNGWQNKTWGRKQ